MRRIYDPKTKEAFFNAAIAARSAKKDWTEAHAAAKEAGYLGSRQGLITLLRTIALKTGKSMGIKIRPASQMQADALNAVAKRPVGRPRKTAALVPDPIMAGVASLVDVRVRAVLDKAIAKLEAIRDRQ